jgi:2-aminoadipate transaminase
MLASLGENFGDAAKWTKPEGGLYVWLTLPEGTDLEAVQEQSFQEGVGYYSGVPFSPEGVGKNSARLCFGYPTAEENYEGVAELARIMERHGVIT